MRKFLLLTILLFSSLAVWSQCVITGGSNQSLTQIDIDDCLAGCSMDLTGCTITIENGTYDLEEEIDLSAYGGLTFTIASNASVQFFDNGSNVGDLILDGTSTLIVEAGGDLTTNSEGTIQITIGGTAFFGSQFPDIVANGGADANGVLPIELVAFSGKAEGDRILLHWTTASEQNNDYMAIEHSLDGRTFREIGRVEGAGNSQSLRHYELVHQHPFNGDNYYRIRQVDFDGAVAYHPVFTVHFRGKNNVVSVFPNPTDDIFNIRIANEDASDIQLQFFDRSGKLALKQSLQSGTQTFSTAGLQTGFYFLRIISGSTTEVIPFEKI